MNTLCKQLSIDAASPGMVLSNDLLDAGGNILLPQGATLTDAILTSLRRHNIDILPILSGDLTAPDEAAEMDRQQQRLERLFRKPGDRDATDILLAFVSAFRLGTPP